MNLKKNGSQMVGILVCLLAFQSQAAEPQRLLSKDAVRNAITTFRQNPFSESGRAAGEMVRRFAEKDNRTLVQVTPKVAPFANNLKITQEDRTILLDAFVVGNVDAQFLRNEKKDNPYAGVIEVIQTYKEMKERNPILRFPAIEKFIEMEKRGELKSYLASP